MAIAPPAYPKFDGTTNYGWVCGATFISKHYAVTAAHCVDASEASGNPTLFRVDSSGGFTVKQIDTTSMTAAQLVNVMSAAQVSGTFPNWTFGTTLNSSHGYVLTPITSCKVKYRCDSDFGYNNSRECANPDDQNRDFFGGTQVDIALIHCPNRSATDYVQVSTANPGAGTNIWVNWFHEVLALQTSSTDSNYNNPPGNWTNYGHYILGHEKDNFHYVKASTNQLLPLQFLNWQGGQKYKITRVPSGSPETWTDIPVCHGTSGSGTMLNGTSDLLGPMGHGSQTIVDQTRLCFDMYDTSLHDQDNVTFINAANTRKLEISTVRNDR